MIIYIYIYIYICLCRRSAARRPGRTCLREFNIAFESSKSPSRVQNYLREFKITFGELKITFGEFKLTFGEFKITFESSKLPLESSTSPSRVQNRLREFKIIFGEFQLTFGEFKARGAEQHFPDWHFENFGCGQMRSTLMGLPQKYYVGIIYYTI